MSRAAPSYETLNAISQALDARDRRSNRSTVPVRPVSAQPLMPGEITARLRGIRDDIASALSSDGDWERDLMICAANRRISALLDDLERWS